jgi:hypothetical protein
MSKAIKVNWQDEELDTYYKKMAENYGVSSWDACHIDVEATVVKENDNE